MQSLREFIRSSPLARKPAVRKGIAFALDTVDRVRPAEDPPVPDRRLILTVGPVPSKTEFLREGERMIRLLREVGGLRPEDDVLDVGCGVGRLAIPLFGSHEGRYEGFDVIADSIRWCDQNITPRHPGFRFHLVDLRNDTYNPSGEMDATTFRFPYEDDSFDFIVHNSVFTHLLPDAAENYAAESARVLRPGGTCFASFLLMDDERARMADEGSLPIEFGSRRADCWAASDEDPEAAVAYWTPDAAAMFERRGMTAEVHRGQWAGDDGGGAWQDVILARPA